MTQGGEKRKVRRKSVNELLTKPLEEDGAVVKVTKKKGQLVVVVDLPACGCGEKQPEQLNGTAGP